MPYSSEEKIIDGRVYTKGTWSDLSGVYTKENLWHAKDKSDGSWPSWVCDCGCITFTCFCPKQYSTCLKCTQCCNTDEVHSG